MDFLLCIQDTLQLVPFPKIPCSSCLSLDFFLLSHLVVSILVPLPLVSPSLSLCPLPLVSWALLTPTHCATVIILKCIFDFSAPPTQRLRKVFFFFLFSSKTPHCMKVSDHQKWPLQTRMTRRLSLLYCESKSVTGSDSFLPSSQRPFSHPQASLSLERGYMFERKKGELVMTNWLCHDANQEPNNAPQNRLRILIAELCGDICTYSILDAP